MAHEDDGCVDILLCILSTKKGRIEEFQENTFQ